MSCRSCGLGVPKKAKPKINKTVVEAANKPHPAKGVITNKQQTSVPTRSPARTFTTLGD